MSLPSRATFHLINGTDISVFCNIGWVYNEFDIPECVKRSAKDAGILDEHWYSVTLYSKTYTKERLLELISEGRLVKEKIISNSKELCDLKIPLMRNLPKPKLIAEDIIGVQPMAEYSGKFFKLVEYKND